MQLGMEGLNAMFESVMFDFVGTLVVVAGFSHEKSLEKMHRSLVRDGFNVAFDRFLEAYEAAYQKYSVIRHREMVEVTNAVWISEALNQVGFGVKPQDAAIKKAVNIYFRGYLRALKLRPCATRTLRTLSSRYKVALVSNFTYAPLVYAGLRKLRLSPYFNAVLVSDEVGWRKPHPKIFEEALERIGVEANQTVFVGDSPTEDIQGARGVGMKAIFIPSPYFTIKDAKNASPQPDIIIKDTCKLIRALSELGEK